MKLKKYIIILLVLMSIINISIIMVNYFKSDNILMSEKISIYINDENGEFTLIDNNKFSADNYTLNYDNSYCEKGTPIFWDVHTNTLSLDLDNADSCYLYFDEVKNLTEKVLAGADEYRFTEENSNNYIKLDGELWRILGAFKTDVLKSNGETTEKKLVKIVKNNITNNLEWKYTDSSAYSDSLIYDYMINHYVSESEILKSHFENVYWNVSKTSNLDFTIDELIKIENGIYGNDEIENSYTKKVSKAGLIYLSDYMYAKKWMQGYTDFWTLLVGDGDKAFVVNDNYTSVDMLSSHNVYPSAYLKENTKISLEGDGSLENPYVIISNKSVEDIEYDLFKVTFDSDGGSNVKSQNVKSGNSVNKPDNPVKNGYNFVCWNLGDEMYDFNYKLNGSIILKAIWSKEIKMYTVAFDSDGGTMVKNQVVAEGTKVDKPENPERKGYYFMGWEIDGVRYNFNTSVTNNITLKAKWEQEKIYTIVIKEVDSATNPSRKMIPYVNGVPTDDVIAIKTTDGILLDNSSPFNINVNYISRLKGKVILVLKDNTEIIVDIVI